MELILTEKEKEKIAKIEDKTIPGYKRIPELKRIHVTFKNGRCLSIIQGYGLYEGEGDRYEIATINREGKIDGSLLNLKNGVEGYLTLEQVTERAKQLMNLEIPEEETNDK